MIATTSHSVRVGFVGIGSQGGPMAMRIVRAGYPLRVWARRAEAMHEHLAEGAQAAASLAELGSSCELIGVCVTTDADVRAVVLAPEGLMASMAAGSSLAIHSTVHPQLVREVAEAGKARGVTVIDAPVSGGSSAAMAGTLSVLVGGDESDVQRWRPVLETYAGSIEVLGAVGAGQLAKLVNNALSVANFGSSLRAVAAAEELGLDRAAMLRVLQASSADSFMLRVVPTLTMEGLEFGTSRYRKDLDLLYEAITGTPDAVALAGVAATGLQHLESLVERKAWTPLTADP